MRGTAVASLTPFNRDSMVGIEHIVKREYLELEDSAYYLPHDTEERLR